MIQFTWDFDPEIFRIGSLALRYYGVIFVAMLLGGFYLFRWQVRRAGGTDAQAQPLLIIGVISVLVGARLGHVIFYDPMRALHDPLWVLQFWKGGLASHGATIGLLIGLAIFARRQKQSYLETLDRFSFSAALGATAVRIGNFLNGEVVGRLTDQTWGVRFVRFELGQLKNASNVDIETLPLRHPSQLYEVALGVLVFLTLLAVDRLCGREKRPRGLLIGVFFVVYFAGRFFVEFFKEYEGIPSSFPLTMGQILSLPAALAGIVGVVWALRKRIPSSWQPATVTAVPGKAAAQNASARSGRGGRSARRNAGR